MKLYQSDNSQDNIDSGDIDRYKSIQEDSLNKKSIKEILKSEIGKLRAMSIRERLIYVWDYYKMHFIIILLFVFIIYVGINIFNNMKKENMLYVLTFNANTLDTKKAEDGLKKYYNDEDEYHIYTYDNSLVVCGDEALDMNTNMKLNVLLGSSTIDVMIGSIDILKSYDRAGVFIDIEELILQDEELDILIDRQGASVEGNYIIIKDGVRRSELELSPFNPICVGIIANDKDKEIAIGYLKYLLDDRL